jgi:transposase
VPISCGRELVKVHPRETSQTCGAAVPKTLAERWHECPECGLSAPRDVVSAQVLLERARMGRSRHNLEDVVSCVRREAVALLATE